MINAGSISAQTVALIGKHVANHGSITAMPEGTITLVAGRDAYLGQHDGNLYVRLEGVAVPPAGDTESTGVLNTGSLHAPAGRVLLGVGDMYSLATHTNSDIQGRDVTIAADHGQVTVEGSVDATNTQSGGRGGTVKVLGGKVALGSATIDASGDAGGGIVLVGGDYQGQGEFRTAEQTHVSSETAIRADAISSGDGGRVIVWADGQTKYSGQISARGGAQSGDGGFVEVSGKQALGFDGRVDINAKHGQSGTLLLDPENIRIVNGGSASDNNELTDGTILVDDGRERIYSSLSKHSRTSAAIRISF